MNEESEQKSQHHQATDTRQEIPFLKIYVRLLIYFHILVLEPLKKRPFEKTFTNKKHLLPTQRVQLITQSTRQTSCSQSDNNEESSALILVWKLRFTFCSSLVQEVVVHVYELLSSGQWSALQMVLFWGRAPRLKHAKHSSSLPGIKFTHLCTLKWRGRTKKKPPLFAHFVPHQVVFELPANAVRWTSWRLLCSVQNRLFFFSSFFKGGFKAENRRKMMFENLIRMNHKRICQHNVFLLRGSFQSTRWSSK